MTVGVVIPNHARWLILPRIWDGINQAKKKRNDSTSVVFSYDFPRSKFLILPSLHFTLELVRVAR